MPEAPKQTIQIQLDEAVSGGIYSNLAIITHSPAEFIIDFSRVVPGVPKAKVLSRIIMTPQHVKSLYLTLGKNIEKFQNQFGEIKPMGREAEKDFGFKIEKA